MGTGADRGARDFLAKLRTSALPHASCRGCRGRGGRGARGEGRRRPASEACPGGPSHRPRPSGGEVRSEPRGVHGASTVGAKWASAAQNDLPGSPQDTSHGTRPPGASRRRWGGRGTERGRRGHRRHQGAPGRARRAELCPIGVWGHGPQLPVVAVSLLQLSGSLRKPRQGPRQGISQDSLWACTLQHGRGTPAPEPAQRRAEQRATGGRPPLCVQTQANAEVQHRRTVFRDSARQLTSQSNDCPWARVTRADRPGWPPRRTPR